MKTLALIFDFKQVQSHMYSHHIVQFFSSLVVALNKCINSCSHLQIILQ